MPSDGDCAPQSFVASLLASACAALEAVAAGGAGVSTVEAQLPVLAFAVRVVMQGAAAPAVAPPQSPSDARVAVAAFVNTARCAPVPVDALARARVFVSNLLPTAAHQLRAWAALHLGQSIIDGASAKQPQLEYAVRLQLLADADVTDASAFYGAPVEARTFQLQRWRARVRTQATDANAEGLDVRDVYFSSAVVMALASMLGLRARVLTTAYAWRTTALRGGNWPSLSADQRSECLRLAPSHKVDSAWACVEVADNRDAGSDAVCIDFVLHGSHFTSLFTQAQCLSVAHALGAQRQLRVALRSVPLLLGPEAGEYLRGPEFTTSVS